MAAFLTADILRAHAAPLHLHDTLCRADALSGLRKTPHPVLSARWMVAPDGRLTCRWQMDASASFGPPPH